jgi:CubicO group peptidase (beta-lactamase class C family)
MKSRFKKICLIVMLFAAICTGVFAQSAPDLAELEKTIEAELAAAKTPGAAVLVVLGDKVVFAEGFGKTSAEDGQPITPDTLFRMGSTTKMFTAASLVTLAANGKLKLNASIGTYVKDLPPKIAALTPHQLLSQSSGIRDFAALVTTNDDKGLSQNIRAYKDDVFFTDPGKVYSYSSPGYWLAGFITEEINGKPYADSLAELLFKPLGMVRSCVRPLDAMSYPLALGHNITKGAPVVIRPVFNNAAMYPGGSIYSSANELSRFAIAMLNGGKIDGKQALAPVVIENLFKRQFPFAGDEKAGYSYGLVVFEQQGVKIASHGGVSRGYGSTIEFAPDQKFAVIVLANSNGQTLPKTRKKAREMFLLLKPETTETPKILELKSEEIPQFTGKFAHAPQTWEVFIKDGTLYFKEDGKDFELKRTGKSSFSYEQGEVVFVPNERGAIEHIQMGLYSARKVN